MWVGVAGKRSHIVYIIKISKFMYNHEQKSLGHLICNVKKKLYFATEAFAGTNFHQCICGGGRV